MVNPAERAPQLSRHLRGRWMPGGGIESAVARNQQSQSDLFCRSGWRHNSGCHRSSEIVNWRRCSRAEQDHLRERERLRMCNGEEGGGGAHARVADCRAALKSQERGTALPHYFDIAPEDALRMSRYRAPSSPPLSRRTCPRNAAQGFSAWLRRRSPLGENATEKPIAESSNGRFDPVDLRGVDAEADGVFMAPEDVDTGISRGPTVTLARLATISGGSKSPGAPRFVVGRCPRRISFRHAISPFERPAESTGGPLSPPR